MNVRTEIDNGTPARLHVVVEGASDKDIEVDIHVVCGSKLTPIGGGHAPRTRSCAASSVSWHRQEIEKKKQRRFDAHLWPVSDVADAVCSNVTVIVVPRTEQKPFHKELLVCCG